MAIDEEGRAAVRALEVANEQTIAMLRHPLFLVTDAARRLHHEGVTREEWESIAGLAWLVVETGESDGGA